MFFFILGTTEWEREGKRKEHNGCAHEKCLFLVVGPLTETPPPPTKEQKEAVSDAPPRAPHHHPLIGCFACTQVLNRGFCVCLSALHYITLHYITLHVVSLQKSIGVSTPFLMCGYLTS